MTKFRETRETLKKLRELAITEFEEDTFIISRDGLELINEEMKKYGHGVSDFFKDKTGKELLEIALEARKCLVRLCAENPVTARDVLDNPEKEFYVFLYEKLFKLKKSMLIHLLGGGFAKLSPSRLEEYLDMYIDTYLERIKT